MIPDDPTDDGAELEPDSPSRPPLLRWLVLLGAAAALGALLLSWAGSDPVTEFENELIGSFDDRWIRAANPTWCAEGCSRSGHEWHVDESLEEVLTDLTGIAEESGFGSQVELTNDGAGLVRLMNGDLTLQVGVTGPDWPGRSPEAEGTAIWFTSVSVFDDQ